MTLPSHPFIGANFFASIRSRMDTNRGLFGGSDGDLQYVIMDAVFYRVEIFRRPATQSFTVAGQALSTDIRVLVNGQLFGLSRLDYCLTSPCPVQWQGEIIDGGTTVTGDPASRPDHRFFGRENAIPVWMYHVDRGDPSGYTPSLHYAMGALLPLIQGGIRFGNGNIGTSPNVQQRHSGATVRWLDYPASKGKTAVGIHRASGCLFVICQEDGASSGMDIATLISRLQTMGVDDAVLCDGSNSASLMVDRTFHVTPGWPKNDSIPTGLMFRLMPLSFGSGATFRVDGGTDAQFLNTMFPVGTVFGNMTGTITHGISGLELLIDSFGVVPGYNQDQVAAEMGIALPVNLMATGTDLTNGETFSSRSPNLTISLTLSQLPGQIDGLEGTLELTNDRGTITGTLEIPI